MPPCGVTAIVKTCKTVVIEVPYAATLANIVVSVVRYALDLLVDGYVGDFVFIVGAGECPAPHAVSKYYEGNPDITWETSYNFNAGVSALLLDNLLNIDIEYFNKRTKDMLYNVPQPPSSGVSYISRNALTMVNRGIEFTLTVNVPLPTDSHP